MKIDVTSEYEVVSELRPRADLACVPLYSETVTTDIAELVEETYTRGVLSEKLPLNIDELGVEIVPVWQSEPLVDRLDVILTAASNGSSTVHKQRFSTGRWARSAKLAAVRLHEEGMLGENEVAHRMLLAMKRSDLAPLRVAPLEPPPFAAQSLKEFGVREIREGSLAADRPVLVNQRLAADAVRRCEEAGTTETGGAVLGKILLLDQPLPGSETRFVTVLSTVVEDPRHMGDPLSFAFSPEGLAAAAEFGELRGLGETVQTVFHTHGWANQCGNCNQNAQCPLAESNPSLQDYQLLESLFSSKATMLPIAGRKLGAEGRRPILQIHAWRGGEMKPIKWQEYSD